MFETCALVLIMGSRTRTHGPFSMSLTAIPFARVERGEMLRLPLFLSRVQAGFPSPADDYAESGLDLNDLLIKREASTFFVRASGGSMKKAGIHDDDVLIVDRAVEPKDGRVVIAALDGNLTVKRYCVYHGNPYLVPESEDHDPIPVKEGQELVVWGVVTYVIHELS